jgi:hypothetical protein
MKSHAKREKTHMAFGAATHPSTSTALATSSELQASLRPLPQVAPSYAPSMHISKICCITVVAPPAAIANPTTPRRYVVSRLGW